MTALLDFDGADAVLFEAIPIAADAARAGAARKRVTSATCAASAAGAAAGRGRCDGELS
jgi:hypothetical protein